MFFRNAESFAAQSNDVLGVFNKTLKKLSNLNEKMLVTRDEISDEIQAKNKELELIDKTMQTNSKVMKNISNILGN